MEDAHDPKWVKVGFKDYWDKTKLKEHYASLKKNPDGTIKITPTMRGQKKGPFIIEKVEEARQNLITEAAKPPIKMLVDSPDPYGKSLFFY